ncbi:uncharacterized protein LOC141728643 [Zonotrichia albicollis]|uniref:uncharacterized protein LOC141728643 n=1 Tax=Zonotrichia albicollis TaxID=44394 RepID=UPI003D80F0B1
MRVLRNFTLSSRKRRLTLARRYFSADRCNKRVKHFLCPETRGDSASLAGPALPLQVTGSVRRCRSRQAGGAEPVRAGRSLGRPRRDTGAAPAQDNTGRAPRTWTAPSPRRCSRSDGRGHRRGPGRSRTRRASRRGGRRPLGLRPQAGRGAGTGLPCLPPPPFAPGALPPSPGRGRVRPRARSMPGARSAPVRERTARSHWPPGRKAGRPRAALTGCAPPLPPPAGPAHSPRARHARTDGTETARETQRERSRQGARDGKSRRRRRQGRPIPTRRGGGGGQAGPLRPARAGSRCCCCCCCCRRHRRRRGREGGSAGLNRPSRAPRRAAPAPPASSLSSSLRPTHSPPARPGPTLPSVRTHPPPNPYRVPDGAAWPGPVRRGFTGSSTSRPASPSARSDPAGPGEPLTHNAEVGPNRPRRAPAAAASARAAAGATGPGARAGGGAGVPRGAGAARPVLAHLGGVGAAGCRRAGAAAVSAPGSSNNGVSAAAAAAAFPVRLRSGHMTGSGAQRLRRGAPAVGEGRRRALWRQRETPSSRPSLRARPTAGTGNGSGPPAFRAPPGHSRCSPPSEARCPFKTPGRRRPV